MAVRRESEQRVELFPFLAVLVCAMGALILLLLVMTRRIRQQAELRAEHERQAALVAAMAEPLPAPPVLAIPPPAPKPKPRREPRWTPQPVVRRPAALPEPPPIYVDPTYDQRLAAQQAKQNQAAAAIEQVWRERVASLSADRARLESELQALSTQLGERLDSLRALEQQPAAVEDEDAWDSTVEKRLREDLANLERRSNAVRLEIEAVGRHLQEVQAERKSQAAQQFTIIPFDARTGTTRRPIVLRCERDRIVLVSEGITLTAADLNGFIPHYNPLSAGVQTLVDGWSDADRGQQPYVLLVVPPDGTISFYVARVFLSPLNIPFGYELVGADRKFTWPQTEPRLVRECRRSIDEVLRDRARVAQLARASGHLEEPLRVIGQGGEFRLDEVDQMRQPGRSVQFGATRIDREQFTAGRGSGDAADGSDQRGIGIFRRPAADTQSTESASPAVSAGPTVSAAAADREVSGDAANASRFATESSSNGGWTSSAGFGRGREVRDPYQWRPPTPSGISVQRDVPVEISGTSLRVAGEELVPITPETDVETLGLYIAQGLENQLAEWGTAPRGFYWSPRIKLIVTPDGAVLSGKLAPIIETWGLTSTLDYASRNSREARRTPVER